jgi:PAS domain S-box-containing protein
MKDPLQAAALAVSSAKGDQVFQELTRYLATILGVQMALIGRVTEKSPRTVQTLGIYGGGAYQENIEYPLDVTPCREVMRGSFAIVPRDLPSRFPDDRYLPRSAVGYAGYPLMDGGGNPAGVIAVTTREPITDPGMFETVLKIFAVRAAAEIGRRAQEEALAASEANYRAIFEASEDAIFLHDYESGAILDVNPKACSTFGYGREEMRRLSVGQLSGNEPPYTNEEALRLIREVRETGGPLRFEWRRRNKDGSMHWDEVTLKKVDIAGRPHVMAMTRQITERKSAVQALQASEEQYRAIFNASADSLVLRDADFRVVDVNPAYEKMSGRSREEALGRGTLTMSPPELTEYVRGLHARALAGEPVMFEALARRKDGSRFNIETRGVPILHQGRPHVLYIGRDITARKSEEDLLRASEEQYRAIFDASADALVLWDSDMKRVDINPAYERIYGYSRAEVLDPAYGDRVPAQYAERRRDLVRRTLAGERCHAELETMRKDGSRIQVEVRTIPIQHRGRPHVLAITRDVTERKRAEEAVRASEEQYRAIFNASDDALVLRDANARVVDVNPAFLEISGYTRDEVIHQTRWIFAVPEMSGLGSEMHRRVIAGESVRFEIQGRRKDGTLLDIEMRAVPIRYRGEPHALGMARDITAQKRAEAERAQLEGQLRQAQKMEAIGHLTGGIAHDFNNILQSILGNLTLAGERAEDLEDAKLARYLERAQLSAQRARELIQQMLTFSRGKRGEPRVLPPAPLVEEAAKLLRPTLPSTIELQLELGETAAVKVDRVQAEQVLLNLCINARDAMGGQGSIVLSLSESLRKGVCTACRQRFSGRYVELGVRDSGPGIRPEVVDRMFEPFYSTKDVGKGSGMGLSMVHGIVHEHGGHVLVETAPGRGAQFQVLFPVAGGRVAPEERKSGTRKRPKLSGSVLVVDDEQMILEFMGDLLAGWGLEVTLKAGGIEAKHAFAAEPQRYDLVLTDNTMPRITGLELARQIRAIRPGTPVILYTGYGEDIAEAELAVAGVRALAKKPVEPAELLALLTTHLQQTGNTPK